jgi:membrane protease subunit HflC
MHLLLYPDSPSSSSSQRGDWRWFVFALLILTLAAAGFRSLFFVDESEFVYVTQFGQPVRFCSEPGLELKWPYQSLRRFDRRLQVFEPPPREMLTEDKENLNFAWYVCWRLPGPEFAARQRGVASGIEQHARRFLEAVGSVEVAENRLEERVQAALAAEIGRTRLTQLISLTVGDVQLQAIAERVTKSLDDAIADQFGIEIVDIRLKRFTYPAAVRPAVFAEIRSERERVAVQYRAQGASDKAKIQSLADLQRDQLLAQAKREALTIRGMGDAKAIEIFNQAHSQDPKFYELLKTLETYRSMLDDQTTVVLSADSPLLKLLSEGVREPLEPQPIAPNP